MKELFYTDADKPNPMKTLAQLTLFSWLLLCACGHCLYSQQNNNQVLQAYVLQNKNVTTLERELTSKAQVLIDASQELLELDQQQVAKLNMACRGDVSRFIQDLVELDLLTKNIDLQKMGQDPNEMQRIWPLVMPARQQLESGLHGKESLYQKTLKEILSAAQQEKLEAQEQQKTRRKIRATTKLTLAEFEKKMPLTKSQRDRIVELIEKSPMPKNVNDNISYLLGIIVLAKLPKPDLREILSEDQMKLFQKMTRNGEQFGGVNW